jgi:predicted unusual protein kinase regulating ubiquinone biosynthesis (AarF/ABC1/UbiB family)
VLVVSTDRFLPTGRLGRFARLAAVGARAGAGLLSQRGEGAADYAAEVLGTMRGLAAKLGQMLSYVDGVLPEEQRAHYETALGALRAAAPRSPWSAVRSVIEAELGAPLDALFAEIEPEPFASASIGQVHRARLHDGRAVAVKVQHPGVADAMDADLNNAGMMERLVALMGPRGTDPKAAFAEVSRRFREELDYTLEAEHQRFFAQLFEQDPTIVIPAVVAERSARRTLTTELASGDTLELAATRPESERRAYAETLWRFVFKSSLVAGRFNADPHPGNYLFGADGVVTFLDFGCVQPLAPALLPSAQALHRAALARDEAAFEAAVIAHLGLRGGQYQKLAVAYSRLCFEPLFASPFRITRAFSASLVSELRQMKSAMWSKDGSFVMLPPTMILLNRLQFGFYSVLARLDVSVDYASIERAFLPA